MTSPPLAIFPNGVCLENGRFLATLWKSSFDFPPLPLSPLQAHPISSSPLWVFFRCTEIRTSRWPWVIWPPHGPSRITAFARPLCDLCLSNGLPPPLLRLSSSGPFSAPFESVGMCRPSRGADAPSPRKVADAATCQSYASSLPYYTVCDPLSTPSPFQLYVRPNALSMLVGPIFSLQIPF